MASNNINSGLNANINNNNNININNLSINIKNCVSNNFI